MATIKQVVGTKTSLTAAGLSTLAAAAYVVSNSYNNTTNQPLDLLVELAVTCGTTSGNKQGLLYAQASLDGSDWQSGPTSGTTVTDQPNLTLIGVLPLNTNSASEVGIFSVAQAYGGVLPPFVRFVTFNDSGASFTAGTLFTAEISATVA